MPTLLVSTWETGLFSVTAKSVRHELAGQAVRGLIDDGQGGVLAIVGAHALCRRSRAGEWSEIARSEAELYDCVKLGEAIFAGTSDARVLRVDPDGTAHTLTGFEQVAGRETWHPGGMMVDGQWRGPPLGVRSMSATCDGGALLVNVHVGGIPRSTDAGATWRPTIEIDSDVHQVCAHPTRPDLVIAAAAVGLCVSRDGGVTWAIEQEGLHAPHCAAVAFGRNDLFVSAATDPFAEQGAVYRRPIEGVGPLQRVSGGLPRWLSGGVDTDCIAARGPMLAVIDGSGALYFSQDDGASWAKLSEGPAGPSGLYICDD
jgi:photosystem II stability/assembly factor-like uncharacterized protein